MAKSVNVAAIEVGDEAVSVKPATMTAEELWNLPEKPGVRYELINGELVEVPGATVLHGVIVALVYRLLDAVVRPGKLGLVLTDGVSFVLARDPDRVRVPDVSFIEAARLRDVGIPNTFWIGVPDLAIEIVSPNDRAADVRAKVDEYLAAGCRLVWVLWPEERKVSVHRPGGQVRDVGPDDELDGGDLLPDFRVRVAALFDVQPTW